MNLYTYKSNNFLTNSGGLIIGDSKIESDITRRCEDIYELYIQ